MRKLLLSFLVIGATVFTSCDKGDDMMAPAQVAADVKVLAIDNSSDFDVFDLDGDDGSSVSGKSSGWSQYKQLDAPNGNKLVYYGSSATFASENGNKTRKQTVLVLSMNANGLSHYSIRHNDVKLKKLAVTNNRTSYKNGDYEGATIRELIGNHVYGVAGISTSKTNTKAGKGASASKTDQELIDAGYEWLVGILDTNNNRWDDLVESALHLAGFYNIDGNFRSANGATDIGYESGALPYYLDGTVVGDVWDFATVGEAIVAAGYAYIGSTHFNGDEILALDHAGFSFVSAGSTSFHTAQRDSDGEINDYIIIDAWVPRSLSDVSPPRQYSVYEEHGDDEGADLSREFENFGEALTYAFLLSNPELPDAPEDDGFFDTPADDSDSGYSGAGVGSNRQFANGRQEQMLAAGFIPSGFGSRFTQDDVILTYRYINGVDWIFIATPSRMGASGRAYADERFGDALVYAVSLLPTTIDFEGRGQDLLDAGFTFTGESSDRFNYSNRYATLSLFKDGVTITVTSDTNAHATYRDYNRFALAVAYANSFIRFEISTIEQNFLGVHGFTLQDNDESFLYYGPEGIALFIDKDGERIYTVIGGEGVVDYDSIGAAVHAANESLALTFVQELTLAERFPSLVRTEIGGAIYYENSVVRLVAFGDGITVTNKASGADHVFLRSELGGQNRVWIAVYAELSIYM